MDKLCQKCGQAKEVKFFRKWRNSCKICIAAQRRIKYGTKTRAELKELNKDKQGSMGFLYNIRYSVKRKVINRMVNKMPRRTHEQGLLHKIELTKKWRLEHPKYSTQWAAKNRLKARSYWHKRNSCLNSTYDNSVTDLAIRLLLEQQNNKCTYCLADILTDYHLDHKTPLSRSGRHTINNIQILCPSCNLSKAAKTHEEYLNYLTINSHGLHTSQYIS